MKTSPLRKDEDLKNAFYRIISTSGLLPPVFDIANLIYDSELNQLNLNTVLTYHRVERIQDIKELMLDLILEYIEIVTENHVITRNEEHNVEFMKMMFRIQEGDFYSLRYSRVFNILKEQLKKLYEDNHIDREEELYEVDLQSFFDLSYDQFDQMRKKILEPFGYEK